MFLTLLSCLVTILAVSFADNCNLMSSKMENFDMDKMIGNWNAFFIYPKSISQRIRCETHNFWKDTNYKYGKTVEYSERDGGRIKLTGTLQIHDSNVMKLFYEGAQEPSTNVVYATDYSDYAIVGACTPTSGTMTWIASRSPVLKRSTVYSIKKALKPYNLTLDQFERYCDSF